MSSSQAVKSVPGAPAPARMDAIRAQAEANKNMDTGVRMGIDTSNNFPVIPIAPDKYDDVANIKSLKATQNRGAGQWIVPFTEADAAYELRKRDAMEQVDYDNWLMTRFDLTDPAQAVMFQQLAPDQYARRQQLIEYNMDLEKRMAMLRLMGPKSEEDLKFEWLVETGRIQLPEVPAWKPQGFGDEQRGARPLISSNEGRQAIERGYFNPIQFLAGGQKGKRPNVNRSDIYAADNDPMRPQPTSNYFQWVNNENKVTAYRGPEEGRRAGYGPV